MMKFTSRTKESEGESERHGIEEKGYRGSCDLRDRLLRASLMELG